MISLKEVGEEFVLQGFNVKYYQHDNFESINIRIKKNVIIEKIVTNGKMWSISEEYEILKKDILEIIKIAKTIKNYKGLEIKIISTKENYRLQENLSNELRKIFFEINGDFYRRKGKTINELLLKIYLKEVLSKKRKEWHLQKNWMVSVQLKKDRN